ncbi:MAG: hypothetical protein DHS20C19_09010 [Acidimicrobiales bacterium]|nr:MAG: hypothetical protein DHS20C19_09010 [Acidimicrobiales bacterium]
MSVFRRAPDAVEMEIDDTLVVVDPASEQMVTLNGVAGRIWAELAEPTGIDALVTAAGAAYPTVDPDRIRDDVAGFLDDAVQIGIIRAD